MGVSTIGFHEMPRSEADVRLRGLRETLGYVTTSTCVAAPWASVRLSNEPELSELIFSDRTFRFGVGNALLQSHLRQTFLEFCDGVEVSRQPHIVNIASRTHPAEVRCQATVKFQEQTESTKITLHDMDSRSLKFLRHHGDVSSPCG